MDPHCLIILIRMFRSTRVARVKICNALTQDLRVHVSPPISPFAIRHRSFPIRGRSYVELPIKLEPAAVHIGSVADEITLVARTADRQTYGTVKVLGHETTGYLFHLRL